MEKFKGRGSVKLLSRLKPFICSCLAILATCSAFRCSAQTIYTPYHFKNIWGETPSGGVAADSHGNLFVACDDQVIRKLSLVGTNWVESIVAGFTNNADHISYADGTNSAARFRDPRGMAVDSNGNIYVADAGNNAVRKITPIVTTDGSTTNWVVSTLSSDFQYPGGVAVDGMGNVYVADTDHGVISKLSQAIIPEGTNWTITTLAGMAGTSGFADGTGSEARFAYPHSLAVDAQGTIFVADTFNGAVRKVSPVGTNWVVSTIGARWGTSIDGTNEAAQFTSPDSIAVDPQGNIFVGDVDIVRKITPVGTNWVVSTLAGAGFGNPDVPDDVAEVAAFYATFGMAVDNFGQLYVMDGFIWQAQPSTNPPAITLQPESQILSATYNASFSVIAHGTFPLNYQWLKNGVAIVGATSNALSVTNLQFRGPDNYSVVVSNAFGTAISSNAILTVVPPYQFVTLAGHLPAKTNNVLFPMGDYMDGIGTHAGFNYGHGLAVDRAGNVYVADTGNQVIRKITPFGIVSTLAGKLDPAQTNGYGFLIGGYRDGVRTNALFRNPCGLTVDTMGNVYVADSGNNAIRKINPDGVVTTLAGMVIPPSDPSEVAIGGYTNGIGTNALFNMPYALALDSTGNLYVADTFNSVIRRIDTNGIVTTIAGLAGNPDMLSYADGIGSAARFNQPQGLVVDGQGNIFVADTQNQAIRKVATDGVVTTIARWVRAPAGIAIDGTGNLYVSASDDQTIVKLTPVGTNWFAYALAGSIGIFGSSDGSGNAAQFNYPSGLALDEQGNIYVSDTANCLIRKGWLSGKSAVTILDRPVIQSETMRVDVAQVTGRVESLSLLEAEHCNGPWIANTTATLVTNVAGISFSLSFPFGNNASKYYRVQIPAPVGEIVPAK